MGFSLADYMIDWQKRRRSRAADGGSPGRPGRGGNPEASAAVRAQLLGSLRDLRERIEAGLRGPPEPREAVAELTSRIAREVAEKVREAVRSEIEKERRERERESKLENAEASGKEFFSAHPDDTGGAEDAGRGARARIPLNDIRAFIDHLNESKR